MINIIPKPAKIEENSGFFLLDKVVKICLDSNSEEVRKAADFLISPIQEATGISLPIVAYETGDRFIEFRISITDLGREGYLLLIEKNKIVLTAEAANGLFYGVQSLLQLLPAEISGKARISFPIKISCCKIEDQPRFGWRGMHLDVSRHFFGTDFIRKYLDLLAMHKFNIFHWHLTDDNGWRIEIKKYPELTDICAWRRNLEHLPWLERQNSKETGNGLYGGFYTQNEISEIIKYAADRFITIVPEIEMPGHSSEVFAAFPKLSCREKTLSVASGGYCTNHDLFCAGKDETFCFLQDILSEVIELFPSQCIHIGGDEADKTYWQNCSLCKQRMRMENLKNIDELQSWFMQQITEFLRQNCKVPIVWDEITDGGVNEDMLVMCWRKDGIDAAQKAVASGCKVVMCPNSSLYFDWRQNEGDKGAFGVTTLEKVYNYEPVPPGFSKAKSEKIIGAQGNVWTEWMSNEERVEYMILPRMCALAEVVWTNEDKKDFLEFTKRLEKLLKIFSLRKINFNIKREFII